MLSILSGKGEIFKNKYCRQRNKNFKNQKKMLEIKKKSSSTEMNSALDGSTENAYG